MEKKKEFKFCDRYNQALIQLIKRKVEPLHKGKKSVLAHCKQLSKTVHGHKGAKSSLPLLPSMKIYNLQSSKENSQTNILDKVKEYLQRKRRQSHIPEPKNELQKYISIFQRPVSQKQRAKRQSIEVSMIKFAQNQLFPQIRQKQMVGFMQGNEMADDDHRSMINAKIRLKLNHKKIIDMNRRN